MAKALAEVLRLVFVIVAAAIILQIPILSGLMRFSQVRQGGCDCNERLFLSNSSQQQRQQADGSLQESCKNESTTSSQSRKLKPLGYAQYPFLLLNVYRYALNTFFVIGETSVIFRQFERDRPVYNCEWRARLPNGTLSESPILTEAKMMYVRFDENGMTYAPAIVNCTFNQSTLGATEDSGKGMLRLHVARGPNRGGQRHSTEEVLLGEPGPPSCAPNPNSKDSTAATVSKFAFCGPPMWGKMKPAWIEQWLTYHNYLWDGNAHFYFYNIGGINSSDYADRRVLEPYVRAGLLTVIDVESSVTDEFPAHYKHQVLFINDCVHRTRCAGHSRSFFFDFDELLHISPPHTIDSLIRDNEGAPWVTFGSIPASTGHCVIQEESTRHLERLRWHNKFPECRKWELDAWLCEGSLGRRKYMINPSKVFASGVHVIADPERGGVHLNASVGRVIHFHGALHPSTNICAIPVNMSNSGQLSILSARYDYDESISRAMVKAQEYAKSHNLLSTVL